MPAESGDHRATTAAVKGGPGMAPPEQEHLPCPRCNSTNTKFCYYNNYNFSQPRHFCKSCRRYWTQGGTLRDIPVGGGTRKNAKRSRTLPPSPSPPPTSFLTAGIVPGSFTSLLNAGSGGFLALGGIGQGFDDLGFGPLARAMWAFPEVGFTGGNAGGWHMETGEDQPGAGAFAGGDCFSWPELAISTPGNALK